METQIGGFVSQAKSGFGDAKKQTQDGVASKAWLYPLKGLLFFINHSDLWRPMWLRLGPSIAVAFFVTIAMFFFTYVPQVMLFGIFNGPLALVNVFFLVLSQSAAITGAITKAVFLQQGLEDTFDQTLIEKGSNDIVQEGIERGVVLQKRGNIWQKTARKAKAPWPKFSPHNLITYLLLLPLNFIPIVGTALFIYLQGKKYGPVLHNRYFALKGLTEQDQSQLVQSNRGAYTAFGMPATLLEHMTPFTGIFFAFTNAVGAALWAHDMDKRVSPDQEFQDFKEKKKRAVQAFAEQLQQGTLPFQAQLVQQEQAANLIGDAQDQQIGHSAAGDHHHHHQSRMDDTAASQVASNLKAQTDALAGGMLKALPH